MLLLLPLEWALLGRGPPTAELSWSTSSQLPTGQNGSWFLLPGVGIIPCWLHCGQLKALGLGSLVSLPSWEASGSGL